MPSRHPRLELYLMRAGVHGIGTKNLMTAPYHVRSSASTPAHLLKTAPETGKIALVHGNSEQGLSYIAGPYPARD